MTAHAGLYEHLGINMAALGCVMLDAYPLDVHGMFPESFWFYGDLPGRRTGGPETETHVTLLFGLLENGHVWREHIDEVLDGWTAPAFIEIREFGVFQGQGYDVVVGHVHNDKKLRDAHHRLSRLPHINTFPYRPHVTVGYVHPGVGQFMLPTLGRTVAAQPTRAIYAATRRLNYGDRRDTENAAE